MSIYVAHLRYELIHPILLDWDLYSLSAEILLLGTIAAETRCGYYLKQENGPGTSIYSMERFTEKDIWKNVISPHSKWCDRMICEFGDRNDDLLKYNLKYATLMCRFQYARFKEKLPAATDIKGMAKYWKKYYNTIEGSGTLDHFVKAFHFHISPYLTTGNKLTL